MTPIRSDSSDATRVEASGLASVEATGAALEVIHRLGAAHGPLMFFQSAGCCDGTHPLCLEDGELEPGPSDLCLGTIGGAPFFIDSEQYARWGRPCFLIDVSAGAAMGFSLEGLEDVHFVTRPLVRGVRGEVMAHAPDVSTRASAPGACGKATTDLPEAPDGALAAERHHPPTPSR